MEQEDLLRQILTDLKGIKARLDRLEENAGIIAEPAPQQALPDKTIQEVPSSGEDDFDDLDRELLGEQGMVGPQPPVTHDPQQTPQPLETPEEQQAPAPKKSGENLEMQMGKRIFSIVGTLSIFFAMVFLIVYSLSLGMLGPKGKLLIGVIVGMCCLVAGDLLYRKDRKTLANALTGGGFSVLYVVPYAAAFVYDLIPYDLCFMLQLMIVAIGMGSALRYDSQLIAGQVLVLGYLIPYFGDSSLFGLIWNLILAGSLIAICYKKDWLNLSHIALVLTYLGHIRFYFEERAFFPNAIFLSAYFTLFCFAAYASSISRMDLQRRVGSPILMSANSVAYYLFMYFLINAENPDSLGLFTIALGGLLMMLSWAFTNIPSRNLFLTTLVIALSLVALAMPVQFDGSLITVGWIIISAVVIHLGIAQRNDAMLGYGNCLSIVTFGKSLLFDPFISETSTWVLDIGPRHIAYIMTIAGFLLISAIYHKPGRQGIWGGKPAYASMTFALVLATVFILLEFTGAWATMMLCSLAILLWAKRGEGFGRVFLHYAQALSCLIACKALILDSQMSGGLLPPSISDSRVFAYIAAIGTVYAMGISDRMGGGWLRGDSLMILGSTLMTFLLFFEAHGAWKSVSWSVFALIHLAAGFGYKRRMIRLFGMALMIITIIKVFLFDLAALETIYRVLSFMVLGIILVATSYGYNRFAGRLEEGS